jgi:hypothetical protein
MLTAAQIEEIKRRADAGGATTSEEVQALCTTALALNDRLALGRRHVTMAHQQLLNAGSISDPVVRQFVYEALDSLILAGLMKPLE